MDQSDMPFMVQFENFMNNAFMGGAKHGEKPQGNNREFHEFLGMLWLNFLYNTDLNNGTI